MFGILLLEIPNFSIFPFCCTIIPTDVSDRRAGLYGALQPVNFCLRGTR